jgi:cytochrome c-type biogenesis protein CcmH
MEQAEVKRLATLMLVPTFMVVPAKADSNQPPAPYAYRQLSDPRQEAQAKALMEELRCLVCQGQSIADSDAELAGDMRSLVRQRIQAGERPEDVKAWLVARYGSWVSYAPVFGPDTLLLYAAPLLLLLVGGLLAARRLRKSA